MEEKNEQEDQKVTKDVSFSGLSKIKTEQVTDEKIKAISDYYP